MSCILLGLRKAFLVAGNRTSLRDDKLAGNPIHAFTVGNPIVAIAQIAAVPVYFDAAIVVIGAPATMIATNSCRLAELLGTKIAIFEAAAPSHPPLGTVSAKLARRLLLRGYKVSSGDREE